MTLKLFGLESNSCNPLQGTKFNPSISGPDRAISGHVETPVVEIFYRYIEVAKKGGNAIKR